MTHDQFRARQGNIAPAAIDAHLAEIGWSAREFAVRIGAHPNTVNDWRYNRRATPEHVERWLADLAECHKRRPPPEWRTRSAA